MCGGARWVVWPTLPLEVFAAEMLGCGAGANVIWRQDDPGWGGLAGSFRSGLGRGGLLVWMCAVALSMRPCTRSTTALRLRSMAVSMAARSSALGFRTQFTTSALCPGWPIPSRKRQ